MSLFRYRARRTQTPQGGSTEPALSSLENTFVQGASEGLAAPLKAVRHPWASFSKAAGVVAFVSLIVIFIDAWSYAVLPPSARKQVKGDGFLQNIVYQATESTLSAKNAALDTVNGLTQRGGSGEPPAPTK
jgi:hypothetical protein